MTPTRVPAALALSLGLAFAASPAASAAPSAPAVVPAASYTLSFSGVPCYNRYGSMALRLSGQFKVNSDHSKATLYHGWFKAMNTAQIVTSSRWYNPSQSAYVRGYTGTYPVGTTSPYWDPNTYYPWNGSQWGHWRVSGYRADDPSATFSCAVTAAP